jgi:predicted  nucleic acid-binding Zn ribbon protein
VVISEISEKPLAITYGSELAEERIKHEIRESDDNIFKKGFNVDVKLQLSGGRPVAYSIMHVHDIIELPDD